MVKKQKPAPEKEETYFVSVKSPLELRRQLLESSKRTIHCLQNYQKIMLIREKKIKEMEFLKQSLKELAYLNKKLNDKLPEYNYETLLGVEKKDKGPVMPKIQRPEKPAKIEIQKPVKEKTELEKLEDSLASIEDKLKNLQQVPE